VDANMKMRLKMILGKLLCAMALFFMYAGVQAERLKDIASVAGVRTNPLLGYGLVVGLDGTGDDNNFTQQSFKTLLMRLGIQLPPHVNPHSKNVAAVVVHAELPPFAKPGQPLDVTVSSIGNAKSLRGGTLLLAPLKAANGDVWAVAQGNLVVNGLGVRGRDGSSVKVNVPVVGRIPNGAIVEVAAPDVLSNAKKINYLLHRPDFTTAKRVADAINGHIKQDIAHAVDGTSIEVKVPNNPAARVALLSALENLRLQPGEGAAKIVLNARTGTVVVGKNVTVGPAAVSHGNLSVTITETGVVSQPEGGSQGITVLTDQSSIRVRQEKNKMVVLKPGPTLDEVVRALNQVGAGPSDLMEILEALQQAGALQAELQVI
jgi:flagellar P-ring protein precursor FlgI